MNHPNRSQIRVPIRLVDELAGALDLALSRLEWAKLNTTSTAQELETHGRKLVTEARERIDGLG